MAPCLFWHGVGDVRRGALCGGSTGGCRGGSDTSGFELRLMAAITGPHCRPGPPIVAPDSIRGPDCLRSPHGPATGWAPDRRSAPSGVTSGGCSVRAAANAPAPPYRRRTRTLASVPVNDRWYEPPAGERHSFSVGIAGCGNGWRERANHRRKLTAHDSSKSPSSSSSSSGGSIPVSTVRALP